MGDYTDFSLMRKALFALGCTLLTVLIVGCGGDTAPKMNWQGKGFLSFPWPNDLRRHADGRVDLDGFPGTWQPLLNAIIQNGAQYITGFGTNSGVLIQFNSALDPDSFPAPKATFDDDSTVMLVNVDAASDRYLQRIPVRLNFDAVTTLYQPGHVLTLLPVAGYALEPDTEYAAIVFTGLQDVNGRSIQPSGLMHSLVAADKPAGMDARVWQGISSQWDKVARYVSDHTQWTPDEVAAFTVYRTMEPTKWGFAAARAVEALDDQVILDSVKIMGQPRACDQSNKLRVQARVELPVWQTGVHPYSISGGMIEIGSDGRAIHQGVETVYANIDLGCDGDRPKIPMVFASGTGGSADAYIISSRFMRDDFQDIALAVVPHQTGDRAAPVLDEYEEYLNAFGVSVARTDLEGITFYNLLNPGANIGNHIQSASEQLFLRRVALLLPRILQRDGLHELPLNFNFDNFTVSGDKAVLGGHSQGGSIVPIALAMDNNFNIGFVNAGASQAYFQAVHRGSIRGLLPIALPGLVESEVDYYHPLMQVLQMLHEPADGGNYARYVKTDHFLHTAGLYDGCIPKEASAALAMAFARAGLLQPAEGAPGESSEFDVYGVLESETVELPLEKGNLSGGGVGLFVEGISNHYGMLRGSNYQNFLLRATGIAPQRALNFVQDVTRQYACDYRLEPGYNP